MNQSSVEQRIVGFVREQCLPAGQCTLLVAVSGGPDSVCMLHVLHRFREKLGVKLHLAHLDHRLRGDDSGADARYVAELAKGLGIPATVEERDVAEYRAGHRLTLEEAAREVRYGFLAQVARSIGAERVAVGHTADDHVETVLMHLIRGSGSKGMRGLQPVNVWRSSGGSITVIRPLLTVSREETEAYCREQGLEPRLDASNLSPTSLRNRIRLELLPLLRGYNPQVVEALTRAARTAGYDVDYIDREVERLREGVLELRGDTVVIAREKFLPLHPALKRHLLRAAMERLLGSSMDIAARHIEDILDVMEKPAGRKIALPGGLTLSVEYDSYLLGPDPAALSPCPPLEGEYSLNVPGETSLPGWHIRAAVLEPSPGETGYATGDNFTALLDFDRAGSELTVRHYRPGDRFQPLGMDQPKKLGEFMLDARIPRAWRSRVPVVCSPGQIVWVAGWRIDERVKVTGKTGRVLRLEMTRCGG